MNTLTVPILKNMFIKFNNMYFDNKLKMPIIKLSNTKSYLGYCTYVPQLIIKISTYFNRDMHDIETTMVHEMIHLWQYYNNCRDGHGKSFKRKAAEINAQGLHYISRCSLIGENVTVNRPPKVRNILAWKDNERICVSVITNKRDMFSAKRRLHENWGIIANCYQGKHIFFETIPCRKKMNIIRYNIVSLDKWNTIVNDPNALKRI